MKAFIFIAVLIQFLPVQADDYKPRNWYGKNHFAKFYVDNGRLNIWNYRGRVFGEKRFIFLIDETLTNNRHVYLYDVDLYFDQNLSTASDVAFRSIKGVGSVECGVVQDYIGSTPPDSYVMADGKGIGDEHSGATGRAHRDCFDLFVKLWTSMSQAAAPVSPNRGLSAIDDWNAHKRIKLPDLRGRVVAGLGGATAGTLVYGVNGNVLGASGGSELITLDYITVPPLAISYLSAVSGGVPFVTGYSEEPASPHVSIQPTYILGKIIKL